MGSCSLIFGGMIIIWIVSYQNLCHALYLTLYFSKYSGVTIIWNSTCSMPWDVPINWNMSSNWHQRVLCIGTGQAVQDPLVLKYRSKKGETTLLHVQKLTEDVTLRWRLLLLVCGVPLSSKTQDVVSLTYSYCKNKVHQKEPSLQDCTVRWFGHRKGLRKDEPKRETFER